MSTNYNRQYVGARYVPVFFNNPDGIWDWASGFSYEPLTMVKYGTNTYTSKSQVPSTVGAPNLNPEYWAQTGDYTGTISELSAQVNQLGNDIGNLTTQLNNTVNWKNYNVLIISCVLDLAIANMATHLNTYGINCSYVNRPNDSLLDDTLYNYMINNPSIANFTHIVVFGGVNETLSTLDASQLSNKLNNLANSLRTIKPTQKFIYALVNRFKLGAYLNRSVEVYSYIMSNSAQHFASDSIYRLMGYNGSLTTNSAPTAIYSYCVKFLHEFVMGVPFKYSSSGNVGGYNLTVTESTKTIGLSLTLPNGPAIAAGSTATIYNNNQMPNGILPTKTLYLQGYITKGSTRSDIMVIFGNFGMQVLNLTNDAITGGTYIINTSDFSFPSNII